MKIHRHNFVKGLAGLLSALPFCGGWDTRPPWLRELIETGRLEDKIITLEQTFWPDNDLPPGEYEIKHCRFYGKGKVHPMVRFDQHDPGNESGVSLLIAFCRFYPNTEAETR